MVTKLLALVLVGEGRDGRILGVRAVQDLAADTRSVSPVLWSSP